MVMQVSLGYQVLFFACDHSGAFAFAGTQSSIEYEAKLKGVGRVLGVK